jgi:UDP-glucuronate 4-epimerase
MNILITGGAGFIGSWTTDALLKKGHTIICVDNFNDYYNPEQKEANVKLFLGNPKYILYRVDIRDMASMRDIFDKNHIDKIIHLAAMAGVRYSIANPELYHDVNINGTTNVLELAREFKIKHLVFASSSSVYGNTKTIPFVETDTDLSPISPYAETKKQGEVLCKKYHDLYGINIVCLRFFTVYGPRGRPDMAPFKFTKNLLEDKPIEVYGDGSSMRDYTYVTDTVSGIIAASDFKGFDIINLGNDKPVELRYFISLIEKYTGKNFNIIRKPMQEGDMLATHANIDKARKLLKYDPQVPIEEGLRRLVEWHKLQ